MSEDLTVHLRLDLSQHDGTVFGRLVVEGTVARAFSGWIGLNKAIDEALENAGQRLRFRELETGVDAATRALPDPKAVIAGMGLHGPMSAPPSD